MDFYIGIKRSSTNLESWHNHSHWLPAHYFHNHNKMTKNRGRTTQWWITQWQNNLRPNCRIGPNRRITNLCFISVFTTLIGWSYRLGLVHFELPKLVFRPKGPKLGNEKWTKPNLFDQPECPQKGLLHSRSAWSVRTSQVRLVWLVRNISYYFL